MANSASNLNPAFFWKSAMRSFEFPVNLSIFDSIRNGAYANMAGNARGPPEMGIPRFLLVYILKVNGPQRHFS